MEFLLILLGLGLICAGPLALILIYVQSLRIDRLAHDLDRLRARTATPAPAVESQPASAPTLAPQPPQPVAADLGGIARVPVPKRSLEERLGARLPIWIGAIALALAGTFLVKYSFDHGLITPWMRIALGFLFGLVLISCSESLRTRMSGIAQGLTSAGIAVLFAAELSGVRLYELIPRSFGFFLMAATAGLAVVLSLRQGPMIALIGLIGGFATPALIGAQEPNPWGLFSYLTLLQAALAAVARRREWSWLAALALGGGAVWLLVSVVIGGAFAATLPLAAFSVVGIVTFLWARGSHVGIERPSLVDRPSAALNHALPVASLGVALSTAAVLIWRSPMGPLEWGFIALISAAMVVFARFERSVRALAFVPLAVTSLMFVVECSRHEPSAASLAWVALGIGALFTLGGFAATFGAPAPACFGWLSALGAGLFFALAWWRLEDRFTPPVDWSTLALLLGCVFVGMTVVRHRRDQSDHHTLAATAMGAAGFVAAAIPLAFDRGWISVAWALQAAAISALYRRWRVVTLLVAVGGLLVGVAVRLLLNPAVITSYPIGELPLVNWLSYGYGVPVVALIVAATWLRASEQRWLATSSESIAMALLVAWCGLSVRQLWHPRVGLGFMADERTSFDEIVCYPLIGLLLSIALEWLSRRFPERTALWPGAWVVAALAMLVTVSGPSTGFNPWLTEQWVRGYPIVNMLLVAFGVPALGAWWWSKRLSQRGSNELAILCSVIALGLAWVLISLQVRHLFHRPTLHLAEISDAEMWCYSLAWLILGVGLVIAGMKTRTRTLRYASLVVMAATVIKVFLFDTSELRDLWRVISFLGLGLSLMALAWMYRRFFSTQAT
jgi:uncharacterized membrane protein